MSPLLDASGVVGMDFNLSLGFQFCFLDISMTLLQSVMSIIYEQKDELVGLLNYFLRSCLNKNSDMCKVGDTDNLAWAAGPLWAQFVATSTA